MGEVLAKAIGEPLRQMWHDTCIYCCDAFDCSSECGCCKCQCVTKAHEHEEEIT